MAFPSVAARATSVEDAGNVTSHTVSLPSGIVSGDLLIIVFSVDGNPTVTWPGGWTPLASVANGSAVRVAVAYRQADGTEGATITVTTSSSERSAHSALRITGAEDPSTQAPEIVHGTTGSSNSPNPPNLNASGGVKDYLWIALHGNDRNRTTSAAPANYSNLNTIAGGGANSAGVATAERQLTASSQDPGTFTISASDQWVAGTIAVYPSAAGQTIAVGTLPETDTPGGLTGIKPATVGIVAETESLLAASALHLAAVGTVSETGSLLSVQPRKTVSVGTLPETGSMVPIAVIHPKILAVTTLAETDTLIGVQPAKAATVGILAQADTLLPIPAVKPIITTVGVLGQSDLLVAVGGVKTAPVGTLATVESLIPAAAAKLTLIGVLAEAESLISIQPVKLAPVGVLAETGSLIPIAVVQTGGQNIAVATLPEADTFISVQAFKTATVGTLGETEALIPVQALKPLVTTVGSLSESDLLISAAGLKVRQVGTLTELDLLIAIAAVNPIIQSVGTLTETDNPQAVTVAAGSVLMIVAMSVLRPLTRIEIIEALTRAATVEPTGRIEIKELA